MDVTMKACDGCGKKVENPYQHEGWIQLTAHSVEPIEISRSTGRYGKSSYETDYLQRVRDFCSVDCLVRALDKKAAERAARPRPECGCDPGYHGR